MLEEQPYSNRELREFFKESKEAWARIEEQTKKTNGRVSSLERWRTGIVMSISVFVVIVIPLAVYAYGISNQNIQSQTENDIIKSIETIVSSRSSQITK